MSFATDACNSTTQFLEYTGENKTFCRKSDAKLGKKDHFKPYVHAPIDKFGTLGRWLRHKLLDGILVGTPVILTIQKHRTPARTTIMKILSFLGTEDFYTILLFIFCWLLDSRLGRLFGALMYVGFYVTGFLKTLLCLPRPPCPPVQPLEKAFDWALPSHHSLLGVIMPWYLWLYSNLHYELSPFNMSLLCFSIIFWSLGVLFSRLYLGVHSPADIVCGGVVGVVILCIWVQVDDYVDFFISQQDLEAPMHAIAIMLLLLCIHPINEPGNPSFLDTCILTGVLSGIALGTSQRSRFLGYPALLEVMESWSLARFIKLSLMRFFLGAIVITVSRILLKSILRVIIKNFYHMLGLSDFNSTAYRLKLPPNVKHYTKQFVLPPIHEAEENALKDDDDDSSASDDSDASTDKVMVGASRSSPKWFNFIKICNTITSLTKKRGSDQWDVNVPIKLVTYTVLSYGVVETLPQLFQSLGI